KLRSIAARALATVAFGHGPDDDPCLGCAACLRVLASLDGNYWLGSAWMHVAATDLGTHFTDPEGQTGTCLVWRSYLCPGCGLALDGQFCKPGDEPDWDVRIAPGALEQPRPNA